MICETAFMIAFAVMKDGFMDMTKERVANAWQQELVKPDSMLDIQIQVSKFYHLISNITTGGFL